MNLPDINAVRKAYSAVKEFVRKTPVQHSGLLNARTESKLFFKCENFQKAGAFKYRGATNALLRVKKSGDTTAVATHSSGNHAGALALAAKINRLKCHVVMPESSPQIKIDAVRNYGAEIIFCKSTLAAREETLEKVVAKTGASFIHPYNNYYIIAGQGTAMLEFSGQVDNLECVIAPVGGGGLLSGTAIAAKAYDKSITVYGAEPLGADDACRSFKAGYIIPSVNPVTMADGLLTSLGDLTFRLISKHVDDILTVSEDAIARALWLIWTRMKIIAEPSACVPLAAVLEYPQLFRNKRTGIILSGGNTDLRNLQGILNNSQLTG